MSANARSQELLVSVGIPTFNRPEGVRRTLDAIVRQTYTNLEIIVSDNASTDGATGEIVHEFARSDPRVRYHRQPQNLGSSGNFQFLLGVASGKYFMWAADDDDWGDEFVERCVVAFDRSDVVSAMSRVRALYRGTGHEVEPKIPALDPDRSTAHNLAAFLRTPMPALLYGLHRRDCLQFFQEERNWFDFYDCYFGLRLLTMGKVRLLPEPLYQAGIDSDKYIVKRVKTDGWLRLSYIPFFRAGRAAIAASDLSMTDKIGLIAALGLTTSRLFVNHELCSRL